MAVKIRLARLGKKNSPFYRIVAIDSRKKRNGQFLNDLGSYNPLTSEILNFDEVRVNDRISKGAIPTDTVKRIHKMYRSKQQQAQAH